MDNAAHMVISFVSHKNEWFTLFKFVLVWRVCVCVKIKSSNFPIFRVYGCPDVQLIQIKHDSTVADICDKNLRQSGLEGFGRYPVFTVVFTGKYRPRKNRFWTPKVGKTGENTTSVLFKQFTVVHQQKTELDLEI